MQLTPEQLKLAQSCKTADELLAKANDAGLSITLEQAQQFMSSNANADLSEEDLDTVAGGCMTTYKSTCCSCHKVFDHELECITVTDVIGAGGVTDNYVCPDCRAAFLASWA